MVAFLNNDISNAWLVVFLQFDASVSDGQELIMQNLHRRAHIDLYFQFRISEC